MRDADLTSVDRKHLDFFLILRRHGGLLCVTLVVLVGCY